MLKPKSMSDIGMIHLKEAILEVLFREPNLTQGDISKRLGIPPTSVGNRFGIVGGTLGLLQEAKRVKSDNHPNTPRWELTETERTERKPSF